ncbi:lipoate--protein ligase [Treponema sp. OttesenSCG-928-L16]|nr:lipoate--protein ligase [Treponema sp. OttesenSCG-928-L16]
MKDTASLRVIRSLSQDIYENLALEDYLFSNIEEYETILFLWKNRDCVVIGRYQNPFIECDVPRLIQEGIPLARRQSGGGTVWHDEGNLCFTFMAAKGRLDRGENLETVQAALKKLGVPARISGRLDISAGEKKISGSAFRETLRASFHHGTVLVNADLEKMSRCLHGKAAQIKSKGVQSLRSPVRNISPYFGASVPPGVCTGCTEEAIIREFIDRKQEKSGLSGLDETPAETMDPRRVMGEEEFRRRRNHLRSREWIFGASPPFTFEASVPEGHFIMDTERGCVKDLRFEEKPGLSAHEGTETAALLKIRCAGLGFENIGEILRNLIREFEGQGHKKKADLIDRLLVQGNGYWL